MTRIQRVEEVPTTKAQKTGVYVGPDGDSRFYKAGDDVARTYKFSHELGAEVAPEPKKS